MKDIDITYMLKTGKMYIKNVGVRSIDIATTEKDAIKYNLYDEEDETERLELMNRIKKDIGIVKDLLGVDKVEVIKKTVTTEYKSIDSEVL